MVCPGYVGAEWVTCQVFTVFIFGNLDIKTAKETTITIETFTQVVFQIIHFLDMF